MELAKEFDVWVLTRESNRKRIEDYFNSPPQGGDTEGSAGECGGVWGLQGLQSLQSLQGLQGLQSFPQGGDLEGVPHFIYFDLPKWARFWKKGLRGVRTYYNIWTKMSNRLVKKTMRENDIKVFHHITYGNALWPVSKYGASQTFVWGPVGGLETIPEEFSRHYDHKSQFIEKLRRVAVKRALKSKGLRKRIAKADLILCKTEDTLRAINSIREKYLQTNSDTQNKAILFTDVAAEEKPLGGQKSPPHGGDLEGAPGDSGWSSLHLLCVGRLDAWRGFDLAILALARLLKESGGNPDATLTIVGKGSDRERLQKLVAEHHLEERVVFTGEVSPQEYRRLMAEADIILNPSLKEGAVTVSFDAMAMGKPLVALDTGGYTRYFKPEYSIVVAKKDREGTIKALADAIASLADEDKREEMGAKARVAAKDFSWEKHGKEIREAVGRML